MLKLKIVEPNIAGECVVSIHMLRTCACTCVCVVYYGSLCVYESQSYSFGIVFAVVVVVVLSQSQHTKSPHSLLCVYCRATNFLNFETSEVVESTEQTFLMLRRARVLPRID